MPQPQLSSEFLQYLASAPRPELENGEASERIPSLNEISKELGLSVACLREQLEVAKAIGLVEVRPRTGIRRLPYSFLPAVRQSLFYALQLDRAYFDQFASLRNQLEAAYWDEAVRLLQPADKDLLKQLVARAWDKLNGTPIRIPQTEHRQFHLTIFSRLDNPFVLGILEAYWEAYEAVGLSVYADYNYLTQVWQYHQNMVDAIHVGDYAAGYHALIEHRDLLYHRPLSAKKHQLPVNPGLADGKSDGYST